MAQQQIHPKGDLVAVTAEMRQQIRARREELEWRQEDLAKKAGTTAATISNIESGRTRQPKKVIFVRIMQALKLGNDATSDDVAVQLQRIAEDITTLDTVGIGAVRNLLDVLKNRR
jgi:transcriptional regulator with XRE-family HTH domain